MGMYQELEQLIHDEVERRAATRVELNDTYYKPQFYAKSDEVKQLKQELVELRHTLEEKDKSLYEIRVALGRARHERAKLGEKLTAAEEKKQELEAQNRRLRDDLDQAKEKIQSISKVRSFYVKEAAMLRNMYCDKTGSMVYLDNDDWDTSNVKYTEYDSNNNLREGRWLV